MFGTEVFNVLSKARECARVVTKCLMGFLKQCERVTVQSRKELGSRAEREQSVNCAEGIS